MLEAILDHTHICHGVDMRRVSIERSDRQNIKTSHVLPLNYLHLLYHNPLVRFYKVTWAALMLGVYFHIYHTSYRNWSEAISRHRNFRSQTVPGLSNFYNGIVHIWKAVFYIPLAFSQILQLHIKFQRKYWIILVGFKAALSPLTWKG